jgi:hypothetical protein
MEEVDFLDDPDEHEEPGRSNRISTYLRAISARYPKYNKYNDETEIILWHWDGFKKEN